MDANLIHVFDPENTRDGGSPHSSLILDKVGNLYGTTSLSHHG
jgi:hypothetical protein